MSNSNLEDNFYYNVFYVVKNVIEYREYKENIQDAIKAINNKFPAISFKESEKAFTNVFEIYLKSLEIIKKKQAKFSEYSKKNKLDVLIENELKNFKNIDVPTENLRQILNYIFYNKFVS